MPNGRPRWLMATRRGAAAGERDMARRDESDLQSQATRYACRNCGADASGGSFCPACGMPVDAGETTEPSPFERREALRQRISDGLDAGRLPSIEETQEADFAPPPVPGVESVPRYPGYAEPAPGFPPPPV